MLSVRPFHDILYCALDGCCYPCFILSYCITWAIFANRFAIIGLYCPCSFNELLAPTPLEVSSSTWGFKRKSKETFWGVRKRAFFSWKSGGTLPQTFPKPMRSYIVKENHKNLVFSEILRYRLTEKLLLYYKDNFGVATLILIY